MRSLPTPTRATAGAHNEPTGSTPCRLMSDSRPATDRVIAWAPQAPGGLELREGRTPTMPQESTPQVCRSTPRRGLGGPAGITTHPQRRPGPPDAARTSPWAGDADDMLLRMPGTRDKALGEGRRINALGERDRPCHLKARSANQSYQETMRGQQPPATWGGAPAR
jgi:hypothetical protein